MLTSLQSYWQTRTPSGAAMALFMRQFATLFSSGIPIIKCCDLLAETQSHLRLRLTAYTLRRDLSAGISLHQAMANSPSLFSPFITQLIAIGEKTGQLELILQQIATYLEAQLAFQRRIRQALFYPLILCGVATCITLTLLIFIIPRFATIFADAHVTLPLLSQWIFSLSDFCRHYGSIALLITLSFILSVTLTPSLNTYLSTFPLIKHLSHKIHLSRFTHSLALTYAAGIPITEALAMAAQTTNQQSFITASKLLHYKITSGISLHQAIATNAMFPAIMRQMIKIGEESGRLDSMLQKCADLFTQEIQQWLTYISLALEPLIILVLGVVIGCLIVGMYLPIFKLGSTF